VLDLRFNGGGGTDIAAAVAGRFVDAQKVYATSFIRAGTSKRTQLSEKRSRGFAPRGPWRYTAPIAVLLGQKCMSSGEELALMMAQCPQAVSFGDHTAGSSAAPKALELAGGIVVNVPRWNDCDAAGKPYEDIGIPPKFPVKAEPEEFTATRDPVIEAALAHLRKIPAGKRAPGKS
jgi:C-terminal processing protease CtpA/Prc